MRTHWFVARCALANPYTDRKASGFDSARKAFAPVYGKGATPEAAEADCRKWLDHRVEKFPKQPESKYAPFTIGTAADWKIEPFTMPAPKFKVGQRVQKVREYNGKKIPAAKRETVLVRYNADHPNSIGTFCTHSLDMGGGFGFNFMGDEKDYEPI